MRVQLLIAALLLVLLVACGTEAPKEFAWQRIDTIVDVQRNGDLHVTETLTVRYTSGTFSFGTRDLPDRQLDQIRNIAIESDGQTYQQVSDPQTTTPYTLSTTNEDGVVHVRWAYPPTTGGERAFTLRYQVTGAVRKVLSSNASDMVWWSMVFPQRDQPVEQASGRIRFPSDVPVADMDATTPDVSGSIALEPGVVLVNATDVPPGQELTLRVTFPQTVVAGDKGYNFGNEGAINAAIVPEDTGDERWETVKLILIVGGLIAFVVFTRWLANEMGWETSNSSSSESSSWRSSRSSSRSSHSSSGSSRRGGRGGSGGASGGGGGSMG